MVLMNMEMPSSCYKCPVYDEEKKCCKIAEPCNEYINGRQANCKIFQDTENERYVMFCMKVDETTGLTPLSIIDAFQRDLYELSKAFEYDKWGDKCVRVDKVWETFSNLLTKFGGTIQNDEDIH